MAITGLIVSTVKLTEACPLLFEVSVPVMVKRCAHSLKVDKVPPGERDMDFPSKVAAKVTVSFDEKLMGTVFEETTKLFVGVEMVTRGDTPSKRETN